MTRRNLCTAVAAFVLQLAAGFLDALAEENPPLLVRESPHSRTQTGDIRSGDYQKAWDWYAKSYFSDPTALAICGAIETDDLQTIDRLLDEGFDVNHRGDEGMTFLLYSLAFPGKASRRLLEKGADPNLPLDSSCGTLLSGTTATQIIAGFGSPEDFQYILDHGTDPDLLCPDTYIPLIRFTLENPANCKILLARGVDINQQDASRGTSLRSIRYPTGSPEALRFYLAAGGDYRNCSLWRTNLLLTLAGYESKLGDSRLFLPPERWADVRRWLETEKQIDVAEVLGNYLDYQKGLGDHDVLRSTLAMASPERWLPPEKDKQLQYFDDLQVLALVRAIDRSDVAEIDRLAEAGVDFHAEGKCGVTPLFWATRADLPTFVRILAGGADPNARLSSTFYPHPNQCLGKGDTIVHWAVRYGEFEHLLFALQAGGDPNARRAYSEWTPLFELLEIASLGGDIGQAVENVVTMYGDRSDLPRRSRAEHRLLAMSLLKLAGADLDAQDVWGRTATMLAFRRRQEVLTFMLLQFGASCRPIDKMGYDLMLQMLQDKRYEARNYGATKTAKDRQSQRDAWDERWAGSLDIIKRRGGDFELAEKTVWKGDDWRPAIDLTRLTPADRKWLPADQSNALSAPGQPGGKPSFPGILELGSMPVTDAVPAAAPTKVDKVKTTNEILFPSPVRTPEP